MNTNNTFKFTGGWLSGFIQADGCFTVTFEKKNTGLLIKPRPIFTISQDISEEKLFKELQKWLGIGFIVKRKKEIEIRVKTLSEFKNILFPILDKHYLKCGKLDSYLIFKSIVNKMICKEHLKIKGLIEIVSLGFQLNKNTTRRTEKSKQRLLDFLSKKHGEFTLPDIKISRIKNDNLDLDFITGLIDGDGSFNNSFQIKPYKRVRVNFTIVQDINCKELLDEVKNYFKCGTVYKLPSAAYRFQVEDFKLILSNIEPILNKVNFNTQRKEYYEKTIRICKILKENVLTTERFKEIIEISYNMNKLGKRRRLLKEELIKRLEDNNKLNI